MMLRSLCSTTQVLRKSPDLVKWSASPICSTSLPVPIFHNMICHLSKMSITPKVLGYSGVRTLSTCALKSSLRKCSINRIKAHDIVHRTVRNFTSFRSAVPSHSQFLFTKSRYSFGLYQMRHASTSKNHNTSAILYVSAVLIGMLGMSYAGVPLYRMFCQATGLGGVALRGHDDSKVQTMKPVKERVITVRFNADTASSMQWNFHPQQTEVKVMPGETALAFYTARNPTEKAIIGISTYNVLPFDAGQYFNKIQCFCFEEQRLNPHEQVDMPVFFFIDPEYATDPRLEDVDQITLSYTFFEAREGLKIPLPGYMQAT